MAPGEPGRKQVISVQDWAEIRRLHRSEGLPIKQIARVMDVSRNTVRAALRADGPPRHDRAAKGAVADGFEPRIRALLRSDPSKQASVSGDGAGWTHAGRTVLSRVAEMVPASA